MAFHCALSLPMILWVRRQVSHAGKALSKSAIDPLNWNKWLKLWVLVQVSFLAFLGPFTQAVIVSIPPRVSTSSTG